MFGPIGKYHELSIGRSTRIADLDFLPVAVEHRVPAVGFVISDESSAIALSGDTAEMNAFWDAVNEVGDLSALFLECALPDEMEELARASCHMTPLRLGNELRKFQHSDCPIYAINLKPIYRDRTIDQLMALNDPRIRVLDVGMTYEF
ncbi:MAG: MBL fold metallo-hydrolase [Pyrinomonadaceae bacterium]